MTQRHHTTRDVYRAAVDHLAHFGDSPAPDETWTTRDYSQGGEPPLAELRGYDEVIATVGVVVDLADELDRVEQVGAEGRALLHFPVVDEGGQTLAVYPGDLGVIRRALDAIEREWTRLGVHFPGELSR